MGDIKALIETAEESLKPEDVDADFLKGKFTLKDLYKQLEAMKKMGPLKKLMEMLPLGGLGVDVNLDDTMYQVTEDKLKRYKVMMDSMTEEELTETKIIDGSRTRRIARGSGTATAEVNELIKYHRMMQKMMKSLTSGRGGGKIPGMKGMKMPTSMSRGKMMKRMK
jgi:signal recognition particle subunit SRP54